MNFKKRTLAQLIVPGIIPLLILIIPLKKDPFAKPYSTVIYDQQGQLIHAHIASDDQWRFPPSERLPEKYKTALILFEDQRFYHHGGVRLESILRAIAQNIRYGRRVSGGSTLTMQAVRLSRQRERNYWQKILEIFISLKWETHYNKEELLSLYSAHAPFGGNIVGLEAASYRYFGTNPDYLSWGESALLAVLPNAPSLMYPGKNSEDLKRKRDRLLNLLHEVGHIDQTTLELSLEEELPSRLYSFPKEVPHLLLRAHREERIGQSLNSTIDMDIQSRARYVLERHHSRLSQNQIENGACLIMATESGEVLAYVGNVRDEENLHSNDVDNISATRSTGSILKPFLYASMLDEGLLAPYELVPDYPLLYKGFSPENYNHRFQGTLPAHQALVQSLNVPFVHLLDNYGIGKFHMKLQDLGMELPYSASHYGLTLIVGGAASDLWTVAGMYSSMARSLIHYNRSESYYLEDYRPPHWIQNMEFSKTEDPSPPLGASSIWITIDSLIDVVRPDEEAGWIRFDSSAPMAWKTGTSWGFRDSWSVGVTPEYVIAVWIGNSSGEGRPGNTGSKAAAPVLFDLMDIMDQSSWFLPPYHDMVATEVCKQSGLLPGPFCEEVHSQYLPLRAQSLDSCPYHRRIHLDQEENYRVDSRFYPVEKMIPKNWFVLPPIKEWYYQYYNSDYRRLPPWHPENPHPHGDSQMEMLYPTQNSRMLIPIEIDGSQGKALFQGAHRNKDALVYWFLDGQLIGETIEYHEMELSPSPGDHKITLLDSFGEVLIRDFTVEGISTE